MYNLYAVTGNEDYLRTGHNFNHWQWTSPLAIGEDDLDGSHGTCLQRALECAPHDSSMHRTRALFGVACSLPHESHWRPRGPMRA
jgi:hypothetical protein